MARLFLACMVLLGLAMAAAAVRPATTTAMTPADATPLDDCNQDLQDLINNCQSFVMPPDNPKIDPSSDCCSVIQRANIPCLCSKVTPAVEAIISMDKVVYVAKYCSRPFQPGSNCGSYHIPDALA